MDENQFASYFEKSNHFFNQSFIGKEISYCKNIEEFYEKCIQPNFDILFAEENIKRLNAWCTMIENYVNKEMPIYWIRKYEGGNVVKHDGTAVNKDEGKTEKEGDEYISRWNTRRGSLTLVVDNDDNPVYAYAYVSNFDAQELYNMCFEIEEPNVDDFYAMMKDGSYSMHYDKGGSCLESDIAFFEQTGNTRSGIMNKAGWYFAHITDVNGDYYNKNDENLKEIIDSLYPLESTDNAVTYSKESEWIPIKSWQKINSFTEERKKILENAGINVNKSFGQKSLRIIKLDNSKKDFDIQKEILKAHFLRFVHPFNYFLVPAKKYTYNIVKDQIGEYERLIRFVKGQIGKRIKEMQDAELCAHWNFFNANIMVKSSSMFSKSEEELGKELERIGKDEIHILYGKGMAAAQLTGNDKIIIDNSIEFNEKLLSFNLDKQVIKVSGQKVENIRPISFKNSEAEDYSDNSQEDFSIGIRDVYEKLKTKSAIKEELKKLDGDEYLHLTLEIENKDTSSNLGRYSGKNEQPKSKTQSNDKSWYVFNGKEYNSGAKLLKAVIEYYASKNNISSIELLNGKFWSFFGRSQLIIAETDEVKNDSHYRKLEIEGLNAYCFTSFLKVKYDHFVREANKKFGYTITTVTSDTN